MHSACVLALYGVYLNGCLLLSLFSTAPSTIDLPSIILLTAYLTALYLITYTRCRFTALERTKTHAIITRANVKVKLIKKDTV